MCDRQGIFCSNLTDWTVKYSVLVTWEFHKENYRQQKKHLFLLVASDSLVNSFSSLERNLLERWMGEELNCINTFWWGKISKTLRSGKHSVIDLLSHFKTVSQSLSTADIWPIIKIIYLASFPPQGKQANALLFDKWF